jgi:uncharacterized repeat protein (TIGR03803 family)
MQRFGNVGPVGLAALALTGSASAAPTETVLHSFYGTQGGEPMSGVIRDVSGNLYGTAAGSGAEKAKKAFGTVFEVSPPAAGQTNWTEQTLYAFQGGTLGDGSGPFGGLVSDASGALYGTTNGGGLVKDSNSGGTVFKLTPPTPGQTTWAETILYEFTPGAVASGPFASLIFDKKGALYGTLGGNTGADGAVFKLAPPKDGASNWTETTLYTFQGGADGGSPQAPVTKDALGVLYGTTVNGGGGTLCAGDQGCGTVFMLAPPARGQSAWTETILYAFSGGADGSNPSGGLILDKNGALYGVAMQGGTVPCGCGVVYKLTPPMTGQDKWTQTVLWAFQGKPDGYYPQGNLTLDRAGDLYGTSSYGGTAGLGSIFKLTPPTTGQTDWTETEFYSFPNYEDGFTPIGGVMRDRNGTFYGTTYGGGVWGPSGKDEAFGTVYTLTP